MSKEVSPLKPHFAASPSDPVDNLGDAPVEPPHTLPSTDRPELTSAEDSGIFLNSPISE